MSEESNDVTKALAAFGAPSIRYHSFGQAQSKQPGANPVRRPVAVTVPPATMAPPAASPIFVQQEEPVAAVEPMQPARMLPEPAAMSTPRPAPFLSEPAPARAAPLFPSTPSVAPPPRPLAEWAAPVSSVPSRPVPAPLPPAAVPLPALRPTVTAAAVAPAATAADGRRQHRWRMHPYTPSSAPSRRAVIQRRVGTQFRAHVSSFGGNVFEYPGCLVKAARLIPARLDRSD